MFRIFTESRIEVLFFLLLLGGSACWASGQLDKSRYITIDEIQPGMEAYCLTCYKGTEIEKFNLEVLSVVYKIGPGKNAILVQGTDERFIHTGPVHGCSGSPVYIQGRLAGALAFTWTGCRDPLYIVTPIEEMLRVGPVENSQKAQLQRGFSFDFSDPLDFAEVDRQMKAFLVSRQSVSGGVSALLCPLITSALPAGICEQLDSSVKPFGLTVVAGISGNSSHLDTSGTEPNTGKAIRDTKLSPGASLAVPILRGDITMTAIGTVTEVVDEQVYALGHGWLGYGPIDLPMATAEIHTVVSHLTRSFKLSSMIKTVGALRADESTAMYGRIGAEAAMTPLTIKVDRYNDAESRLYNCQLANNRLLTPLVLGSAVAGAALMLGDLPPDNMVEYKVAIGIEDTEPLVFENVSTVLGLTEIITETVASVAILLNNPYKEVAITSLDFDIRILSKNIISHIWSVNLSDSKVEAGQEMEISVILESVLAGKKKYRYLLELPENLSPGKYDLIVCGGYDYQKFLKKAMPHRFTPQNLSSLIEAMNNILAIRRDKLYCLLVLPAGGVTVEKAELPDLPATKALVLRSEKRTLQAQPYQHWIERTFQVGTVIIDKKTMHITIEKGQL